MTDDELRNGFAFMLAAGFAIKGEINPKAIWEIADMLVEAREEDKGEELGIAAVKPRKRYNRKGA
jgi:hypothetical protein